AEALADAMLQRANEAKTAEARAAERDEAIRQLVVGIERVDPQFRAEFAHWLAAAEQDEGFIAGIDAELTSFHAGEHVDHWSRMLNARWLENEQWAVRALGKLGDIYSDMGKLKEAGASYAVELKLTLALVAHDEAVAREKKYDNERAIQDV